MKEKRTCRFDHGIRDLKKDIRIKYRRVSPTFKKKVAPVSDSYLETIKALSYQASVPSSLSTNV